MKIGIVTTWFERGAAYVSRAYRDVLAPQNEVFIYARGGEKYAQGAPKWDDANVTWGKRIKNSVVTWIDQPDFWRFIEERQIECLIFNEQRSYDVLVALKDRYPTLPIGAYVDYYTPDTVKFFGIYDFLLCNTRRHFGVFDWHPGALFVPWGTDLTLFSPRPRPIRPLTFFHSCGMDSVRKGTESVIRSWAELGGNSRLLVHAQVPLPQDLLQIAARKQENFELHVGDVTAPGLYHRGDVYVYPTILEGVGLTIAEALASGLPVITTDNGPMNEWVQNGVSGRVVAVERFERRHDNYYWPESYVSLESLREAMQFYEQSTDIAAEKANARDFAEEHLNWAKNAAALSDFLQGFKGRAKPMEESLRETMRVFSEAQQREMRRFLLSRSWPARLRRRILQTLRKSG